MPTKLQTYQVNFKHKSCEGAIATGTTSFQTVVDAQSLNNNLIFDFEPKTKTFTFEPIVNERVLHGYIRLFDDKNCYEDIEVFINQDNGIWVDEGEYVERIVVGDCCVNGNTQTISLDGNSDGIQITCGDWVNTVKAFTYMNDDISLDVSSNENGYLISITLSNCETYDTPIYVCGYDEDGRLIAQTVFYLTVLFEQLEEEECFLSVSPSQIILTNEQYQNEDFGDLQFNYTVYSPNESSELKVRKKVGEEEYIETSINTITADTICTNSFSINPNTYLNLGVYTGITSNEIIDLDWVLSSSTCKEKTRIVVQKYVNNDPHLYVKYNNIEVTDKECLYFDNIEAIVTTGRTIDVPYKDIIGLNVDSSGTWVIYSYDSSVISCFKNQGKLEIQLINYEQVNNLEIVLKNTDNIFYTIKYSIAEGLVVEDQYEMYWCENSTPEKVSELTTYNYGSYYQTLQNGNNVPSVTLHSAYALAIDNLEPHYGDWTFSSSRNITYEVKQYRKKIVDGNDVWCWDSLRSMTVGTKALEEANTSVTAVTSHMFDTRVFVGAEPISKQESDVWITTDNTFTVQTDCYIDFFQVQGEAYVRLNITHPPVVKYHIYTDQDGEVRIDFKKS